MRHIIFFAVIVVAGCASTPDTAPVQPPTSTPLLSNTHEHENLNGMTAVNLVEHLGTPRIQIREGDGLKIQFAGPNCLLDAYLYQPPNSSGAPRVTHIDARNYQGDPFNPKACIASIEGR